MLDLVSCGLVTLGLSVLTIADHPHTMNEVLTYQRWAFKKLDSLFGVSKEELVANGWTPKKACKAKPGEQLFGRNTPRNPPPKP